MLLHLQEKEERKRQKLQAKQKYNLLVSIQTYFVLRVCVELWGVKITNIMSIAKYEYEEYFKL